MHVAWGAGIRIFFLVSIAVLAAMSLAGPDTIIIPIASYLPLHTIMETFSVMVCALIFAVGWSTFSEDRAKALVVLACALLSVGLIDTAHFLSYPGMPDFVTPSSAQKSIFFWLSARTILVAALLYTAAVRWRAFTNANQRYVLLAAALSVTLLCLWIGLFQLDITPPLYVAPTGLTPTKVIAESLIAIAYVVAGCIFFLRFQRGADRWMRDLAICCWSMALSEIYFALFRSHSDLLNIVGHVYKVIAYGFLYRAIFLHSVRLPINLLRASEAALRTSQKALRTTQIAVDRSSDYIFIFDAAGRFSYVNARAIDRLGYSQQELLAMKVADIDADYRGVAWEDHWSELLRNGSLVLETMHRSKAGESYPVEVSVTLIQDNGEKFACAIVRDISERIRAEQRVLASLVNEERARAEARTKGEFLARMSHEIRTPMNGILGMSELLLESGLNSVQAGYCRVMNSSASALLGVINDILDISKIEAGYMAIEKLAFALPEVIDDVLSLFQLRASEKNILLLSHIDAGIPAWVIGDPTRIRQILINFVSNAIKFTDVGQVKVSVRQCDSGTLRIDVEDSGKGIAPEVQQHLFASFTQADASIARTHGGTGLGLVITKELATLMGGTVGLHSEVGKGSCFWVELPLPATTQPESKNLAETRHTSFSRPLTLLVVDDNSTNQLVIQAMLRKLGHASVLAADGVEAINIYKSQHAQFDGILMDCEMPEMNGFETTEVIRSYEAMQGLRRCPIIAVTANALEESQQSAMRAGMDDYLAKPLSLAQLAACLSTINTAATIDFTNL